MSKILAATGPVHKLQKLENLKKVGEIWKKKVGKVEIARGEIARELEIAREVKKGATWEILEPPVPTNSGYRITKMPFFTFLRDSFCSSPGMYLDCFHHFLMVETPQFSPFPYGLPGPLSPFP